MKLYTVTITEQVAYTLRNVSAGSESEAKEIALETLLNEGSGTFDVAVEDRQTSATGVT